MASLVGYTCSNYFHPANLTNEAVIFASTNYEPDSCQYQSAYCHTEAVNLSSSSPYDHSLPGWPNDVMSTSSASPTNSTYSLPNFGSSSPLSQYEQYSGGPRSGNGTTSQFTGRPSASLNAKNMASIFLPKVRVVKRRVSANKKERRRTISINTAFSDLRDCIPNVPMDTKLSKIKTLRLATSYIAHLMEVLDKNDGQSPLNPADGFRSILTKTLERRDERRKRGEALKVINTQTI
ncbi:hypothetical protein RvY_11135-2 [Ramazzottius varieornatus]|uniref:BHLH domain-containing protein n=1 Tax=Ramazzottius varieornatus TaxID=947166 RepID=A0A1D1VF51_RAMVA|nr:hypothetical protein RvY_11135-2 [Ramazzottius varieornatus]